MTDFDRMIKKANTLDIKVVLEFNPNHFSNESEIFLKSIAGNEVYREWFIWADPLVDDTGHRKPPTNWLSVFGKSAWEYESKRNQYYLHQFSVSQPDLNYRNQGVISKMKDILKFWMKKGIKGVKLNDVVHLYETDMADNGRYVDEPLSGMHCQDPEHYDYLQHTQTKNIEANYDMVDQWREVLDDYKKRDGVTRVLITEAHTDIKRTVKFYRTNGKGAHVPLNLGLIDKFNSRSDARDLKVIIDQWLTYVPRKKPANWIIGNHDIKRAATRFRKTLVDALNMLVLLLPGVAITYQGEELGMKDGVIPREDSQDSRAFTTYHEVSRDPARTPFQWNSSHNAGFSTSNKTWLPVGPDYETLNAAEQRAAPTHRSHYLTYRALAALRQYPEFRQGDYDSVALAFSVFAFKRQYKDSCYVVAMNIGHRERKVDLTVFSGVSGRLKVVSSSLLSSRTIGDYVDANALELAEDEALVLHG